MALIANPGDPFRSQAPESEWNRPYAERTKVTLAVADDESLAEVLERAAAQLSLVPPTDFVPQGFSATRSRVAFYRPDDEAGFGERYVPRFLLGEVTLVDGAGRVIFGASNLRAITYRELLAAAEAGVLGGDPLRPYLIIEVGYGDMPPPDLALLLEGLAALRETMQVVIEAGGALMVAKWVRDAVRHRLRRGQEALEKNKEWIHRGYSPYQFVALIRSRAWATHELATALGCGADEAEAMLWVLGFAQDPENGRWVPGGDEPANCRPSSSSLVTTVLRTGRSNFSGVRGPIWRRVSRPGSRDPTVHGSTSKTIRYSPPPGRGWARLSIWRSARGMARLVAWRAPARAQGRPHVITSLDVHKAIGAAC